MKKLSLYTFLVLMVCNIGVIESSQAISTTDLHKACKISMRFADDINQTATPSEMINQTICNYYFLGLLRGAELQGYLDYELQNDLYENILRACKPPSTRVEQVIRIFIKYLDNHPEKLHLLPVTIVHFSLSEAFPCNR